MTGKQSRVFQPPSRQRFFSSFTTDASRTKLYAMDKRGTVFVWALTSDNNIPFPQPIHHTSSPPSAKQGGKNVVQPSQTLETNIRKLEGAACRKSGDVINTEYVDNGLIIRLESPLVVFHVDLTTNEASLLTDHKKHDKSNFWRLDRRHVLLRTKYKTGKETCALYDSKTKSTKDLPDMPEAFINLDESYYGETKTRGTLCQCWAYVHNVCVCVCMWLCIRRHQHGSFYSKSKNDAQSC